MANWTKNDAVALRNAKYLPRLIEALRERKPKSDGKTIEEAALNARRRDGFDECIEAIKQLYAEEYRAPDAPDHVQEG